MGDHIKKTLARVASPFAGAGAGYLYSLYAKATSAANIRVRPELVNVDWTDAFLSGHLPDWLFYHSSNEMTIASVGVGAAIAVYFLTKYFYDYY